MSQEQAEQGRIAFQMERKRQLDLLLNQLSIKLHDFRREDRDVRYIYAGLKEYHVLLSSPQVEAEAFPGTTKRLYGIELIEVHKETFLDIG